MRKHLYCSDEYIVDSDGYVLSKRNNKPLKPSINHKGYAIINIMVNGKRKGLAVHTAIARTFLSEQYKDGLQVNHKDGNKLNNNINNLEWTTGSENMRHSVDVLGNHINDNNINAKAIQGIDINNNVIYDYSSIAECAKHIALKTNQDYRSVETSIWRVLKGYRKTYKGLRWIYK